MVLLHLTLAFTVALLLVTLFSGYYRRDTAWSSLLIFFLIIFLASWVGGVWFTPFGPVWWGVPFMPFLLMGLLFALVLAASIPKSIERKDRDPSPSKTPSTGGSELATDQAEAEAAVSVFVWIMLMFFVFLLVANYAS